MTNAMNMQFQQEESRYGGKVIHSTYSSAGKVKRLTY